MPRVIIESYSRYFHRPTRTEFTEILDRRTGCFVGIAEVEDAEPFQNAPFRVLTDEDFLAMTSNPKPVEKVVETGDPLKDKAKKAPPAPPASK